MSTAFTYFKEIISKDNCKFTLDFSDEGFIQKIVFLSENDYYISSLFVVKKIAPLTYNFIIHPKFLYNNYYRNQFYDTDEKKLRL